MNKIFTDKKSFLNNLIANNYGIGKKTGSLFLQKIGLNNRINPKVFKRKQISEVSKNLQTKVFGKKLREDKKNIISFLARNKTYRGIRHKLRYPARGQRTHTNAKTKKKFTY
jgi:small subunit ribosomal protein S13